MNSLLSFLQSIRWQDFVDVLLNSYILFRLYVLFRGTNVLRVLLGIALLWIFQRIAVALGLIVSSWAMQGIIAGAALIIVIVFRNEIRNVLQAKNLRALLWDFPHKAVRTPIDSIVEGVYELARTRTGALIVIPGKDDLDEIIQGGVRWDGLISKEMLLSVFYNGNPVHDGAAVLQNNRVTRVGAILPLSLRDDLPQYYGTRHRAAVGLAEQSDALVIAVSEERGQVVAAKGQSFVPIYDNLSLKKTLAAHVGATGNNHQGVRREQRELAIAAMISLLCMTGVWFSIVKGMETLTSMEVPLEYSNRDAGMQIVSTSINTVRLHLSSSSALIGALRPDKVKVKLDLSKAANGLNTFNLTRDNIVLPPGIRLNRIEPPAIQVVLDVPTKKEVPIQVDWVGALPEGLILEGVSVTPSRLVVIGTKGVLEQIDTLYTEKVRLDRLTSSGQLDATVVTGAGVRLSNDTSAQGKVNIRYTIRRRGV